MNKKYLMTALVGGTALLTGYFFQSANAQKSATTGQVSTEPRVTMTADELFPQAYTQKASNTKTYQLIADEKNSTISLPNGTTLTLDSWLYNDQLANELRIKHGEALRVTFVNNLSEPSTIHWHGLRLPQNMDGVPDVSQKAVQPGERFVYEFTPKDAGTFWFHPHTNGSEQLERGLYGALIVEPQNKSYDEDITLMLDDWRLNRDGSIDENFVTPMDRMHDGRWGQLVTVNGEIQPTMQLIPGTRVRVRLINAANARIFTPISNATWKIVASDGMDMPTQPLLSEVNPELAPGDRIDIELVVPKQAEPIIISDSFSMDPPFLLASFGLGKSVEEYTQQTDASPPAQLPDWSFLLDKPADYHYRLGSKGMHMSLDWAINGETYDQQVKEVWQAGELIKIRFTNESSRLHPMHLHGQFFQVLSRNGAKESFAAWQDTILVKPREIIEIALVPSDVGVWPLHCHIQEHADAGMMRLIEVKPPEPAAHKVAVDAPVKAD